jgi:hypothetical protein
MFANPAFFMGDMRLIIVSAFSSSALAKDDNPRMIFYSLLTDEADFG